MHLSVIIPTRNRSSLLEKAIQSQIAQTYPQDDFEVIIIDNGSTDGTKDIVESYKAKLPRLIYAYEPSPGLHAGRHAGLKIARGDILVYADDDIEAFPTWLEGIAESFEDPSVALVGGNNLPRYESSPPEWVNHPVGKIIVPFSTIDLGNEIKEISPNSVYGCNFSIRKKVLIELGGFHPDGMPEDLIKFRGDGESAVSAKIIQKGYKTMFNPKASVYHWVSKSRMTPEYLYKRGYLQGISNSYAEIRKNGSYSVFHFYRFYFTYAFSRLWIKKIRKINEHPYDWFYRGSLDGFKYHQKMASKDKKLLEWILKKDYLDEPHLPQ